MSREVEVATQIYEIELKRKDLEEQVDDLRARYSLLQKQLIDILIDEGKSSTGHIEGVGELSIKKANYPSVVKANMPDFMSWLRKTNQDSLIKEVVEPNTLKKFLADKIDQLAYDVDALRDNDMECAVRCRKFKDMCVSDYGIQPTDEVMEYFTDKDLESDRIASLIFELVGAKNFQDYKISHTKKGK